MENYKEILSEYTKYGIISIRETIVKEKTNKNK